MLAVTSRRPAVSLSRRELWAVLALAEGMTVKEIAAVGEISHWTVRSYLANARRRTESLTNAQLIRRVIAGDR